MEMQEVEEIKYIKRQIGFNTENKKREQRRGKLSLSHIVMKYAKRGIILLEEK